MLNKYGERTQPCRTPSLTRNHSDGRGEHPFLWPLTSFLDQHTYSVHSVQCDQVSPPALNGSAGTSSEPVALQLAV